MFSSIKAILSVFLITVVFLPATHAYAQVSTSGSATTSWGSYSWQVDQAPVTTTITSTFGFSTPPGLVQIPVNIPAATTVHEVHGNITIIAWQGGSTCNQASIIGELRDQNGNVVAGVKLQQFGPASANVPIVGTFSTPLSVASLQLQLFVDLCGAQTLSMALVMS